MSDWLLLCDRPAFAFAWGNSDERAMVTPNWREAALARCPAQYGIFVDGFRIDFSDVRAPRATREAQCAGDQQASEERARATRDTSSKTGSEWQVKTVSHAKSFR